MIEFLNREMQNVEVLGLELKCFGKDAGSLVLSPRIIGQTQVSIDKKLSKPSDSDKILWSQEKLKAAYEEFEDKVLKDRLLKVLDWAVKNNLLWPAKRIFPIFGIKGNNNRRILTFFHDDKIYLFSNARHYKNGEEERDQFIQDLKNMKLLGGDFDPYSIDEGRALPLKLSEINEDQLNGLLNKVLSITQNV